MNFADIISTIIKQGPSVEAFVAEFIKSFKTTTAPAPTTATTSSGSVTIGPSPVIKDVQHLLNLFVKPVPPLKEDGWLGKKTEDALGQAVAMAKPYLALLGG